MIKFEEWYDGLQTKIKACSSEETKKNNNVECYYSVGNYIKKEIEYMQQTINKQQRVLDKIKEYCENKIEEQKNMPDFSKSYLENYDKAIKTQHLSHSGVMLETVKSTTLKRCEEILEIIKGEIK